MKNSVNLNYNQPFFFIGAVAEMLQVHERTLRIYDELKLLVPHRSTKNRRLYSINDVNKGLFIQYLTKNLGVNLAGAKIILYLVDQNNVHPEKYQVYMESIVENIGINQQIQNVNKQKFSKRGRKKQPYPS